MAKKPKRRKPIEPNILGDGVKTCLACGTEIHGIWCHNCGQKNDDCRRSITRLAAEVVRDTAALDSRFWRTWISTLTKPGTHIQDYAHGRRSPFTPPVRFFFVVLFMFFFSLWITERNIFVLQLVPEYPDEQEQSLSDDGAGLDGADGQDGANGGTSIVFNLGEDDEPAESEEKEAEARLLTSREDVVNLLSELPPEIRDGIAEGIDDLDDLEDLDEDVRELIGEQNIQELLEEAETAEPTGPKIKPYGGVFVKAQEVVFTEEERQWFRDAVSADTTISGPFGQTIGGERLAEGLIFTMQNPAAFNNALNEAIPILLLLFVPFMAILGAVFIRGEDALIYDHLLVAIQTHAFTFLLLIIGVFSIVIVPGWIPALAVIIGMPVYYALALKGAFQRSWRKTIVATIFVGWNYLFFFMFGLFGAVIAAFLEIT